VRVVETVSGDTPEGRADIALVDTVKTHVRNVFRELDVPNRTLAALAADRFGLAAPSRRRMREQRCEWYVPAPDAGS